MALKKTGRATTPLAAMVAVLFSTQGILSPVSHVVQAARSVIRAVCATDGAPACAAFVEAVERTWDNGCGVHEVSERDVAIFKLAPGELFEEVELDEYVPEEVDVRRKNKEEAWAEEVRREIAAKRGAVDDNPKSNISKREAAMIAARDHQAALEAVVKRHVQTIQVHVGGILEALEALGQGGGVHCLVHLPRLIPIVASVLGSPLVSAQAQRVFSVLAKHSKPAVRMGYRLTLPMACGRVKQFAPSSPEYRNGCWMVEEIVSELSLNQTAVLEPPSFSVILPLLQAAVSDVQIGPKTVAQVVALLEPYSSAAVADAAYAWGSIACVLLDAMRCNEVLLARCVAQTKALGPKFSALDASVLFHRYPGLEVAAHRQALLEAMVVEHDEVALAWMSRFDPVPAAAALGEAAWKASGCTAPTTDGVLALFKGYLLEEIALWARQTVARGIADVTGQAAVDDMLTSVFALFGESDRYRFGVADVLAALSPHMQTSQVLRVITWIFSRPLACSDEVLREAFTSAGATVVVEAGAQCMDELWQLLDDTSKREVSSKKAISCVIFIASLASHMTPEDPRLLSIVSSLLDSLVVSSEPMQQSIARHLPPLMAMVPESEAQGYVTRLLKTVEQSKDGRASRGAAWGMSGLVKGRKLPALKKLNILRGIERLLKDKKRPYAREGGLNMIECLVRTLGKGFEAYYILLLQQLLDRYGDNNVEVRAAAETTAKTIMTNLSASGVRLVLGPLLKSLSGSDWRRKKGGIELLASMAYINPTQLSSCLPAIVPVLTEVLRDTHQKVQEAARVALQNIGGVITNAEIKQHVPLLLKAFHDPDHYTEPLLSALLHTQFVHVIDAASLALLMPAVMRALSHRRPDTKLMAVQIVGNIGSLTKPNDLAPYLKTLSVELRAVLIDASPEIRSAAALGWGNLLQGMGETKFPDLLPWLIGNFEISPPLRATLSGSAQGLAQVLAAVPKDRYDALMEDMLMRTQSEAEGARQGALLSLAYLPRTDVGATRMEERVLPLAFDAVLRSFSDEMDDVRNAAVEAGKSLLERFYATQLDVFLPRLEASLFDPSWRTRLWTCQMLGTLFDSCGGVQATDEEIDDPVSFARQREALVVEKLGQERFDKLLAALYVVRCETNASVKQVAVTVFKGAVANLPKTVKRIMSQLMRVIVACLGSSNAELRETAGRTLGELVERLAGKVLSTVLPALSISEEEAKTAPVAVRQGANQGLKHLVAASSKTQLQPFASQLTRTTCTGLLDEEASVREAAAEAFSEVFHKVGTKFMSNVVDVLLVEAAKGRPYVDDSLRMVASSDPGKIVPVLVPKLVDSADGGVLPLWAIKCLASTAEATGAHFARLLGQVLPALGHAAPSNPECGAAALRIAEYVPQDSMHILVDKLVDLTRSEDTEMVVFSCTLIGKLRSDDYLVRFVEIIMALYVSNDDKVLDAACGAVKQLLTGDIVVPTSDVVLTLRNAVQGLRFAQIKAGSEIGNVPGFNRPVGLTPVISMLKTGMMSGAPEIRQIAAETVVEVLRLCTPELIKAPTVMQLAPIIRVLGEKAEPSVKRAILITLHAMLQLVPKLLRALVPQFQTVFVRSLQDGDEAVREEAAKCLGELMALNPRVDPLVNDLSNSVLSVAPKIRHSILLAIAEVLSHAGARVSPAAQGKVFSSLIKCKDDASINADEKSRRLTASALGVYSSICGAEQLVELMDVLLKGAASKDENLCAGNQLGLATVAAALQYDERLDAYNDQVLSLLCQPATAHPASRAEALGEWCIVNLRLCPENIPEIVKSLIAALGPDDRDVRVVVLKTIKRLAKLKGFVTVEVLDVAVLPILERAQDKRSFPVKLASERCLVHLLLKYKAVAVAWLKTRGDEKQAIQTYVSKVLSKLKAESDDDE